VVPRVCACCGKICHPTRGVALRVARRAFLRERRLRACRCPAGLGWHLTSRRPPRKVRAARQRARRYAQVRACGALPPVSPQTLAAGWPGGTGTVR
jgi:hypothetical protein